MKDCNYHHFLCFLRWAMDLVHGIGKWLTTHQLSSIPPSSYCWKQGISRGWGCHYVYPIIHLSIYLSNPTYKYTCVYTYTLHILYRIYIYIFVSLFKYHILHRPRGHGPLWPGALPSRPLCPRHLATLSAARAWWSQEMAIFFGWKFTKENGDGNRSLGNTWLKVYSKCESLRCIHKFGAI